MSYSIWTYCTLIRPGALFDSMTSGTGSVHQRRYINPKRRRHQAGTSGGLAAATAAPAPINAAHPLLESADEDPEPEPEPEQLPAEQSSADVLKTPPPPPPPNAPHLLWCHEVLSKSFDAAEEPEPEPEPEQLPPAQTPPPVTSAEAPPPLGLPPSPLVFAIKVPVSVGQINGMNGRDPPSNLHAEDG